MYIVQIKKMIRFIKWMYIIQTKYIQTKETIRFLKWMYIVQIKRTTRFLKRKNIIQKFLHKNSLSP